MEIRPEQPEDVDAIRAVTADAFRTAAHSAPPVEPGGDPGEATLVAWLREDPGWIPELSLVAEEDGRIIGHVVATRALLDERPVLGLGPLSVLPDHQRSGVGSALLRALLDAAGARGESLIGLLGDPRYYGRFGFVPAAELGVIAPDPSWGAFFQARALAAHDGRGGAFRYAPPFDRL
ncbi:GNAT family N-acetyltransferase [Brachybacterium hainanense]|uniref:GNAT family N-acetyltransferase n=1 Tax=Brachybacterium hainanense TaxID=1541174 RepID=A0ABV6RDU8_9MICO